MVVPGRAKGPVLQDITTSTVFKRTVNIEVTMGHSFPIDLSDVDFDDPGDSDDGIEDTDSDETKSYNYKVGLLQPRNANSSAPVTEVERLLKHLYCDLAALGDDGSAGDDNETYDQIFKESDTSSWNPRTGRYTRSVTWVAGGCTHDSPDTTFGDCT